MSDLRYLCSSLPPVVCRGLMSDLRYLCSSLPPVVCRGLMSDLRYLCFFAYSGVQHILYCVFVLLFFVLCTPFYQFLWIVHFWLPLWYSLTFIKVNRSLAIFKMFFISTFLYTCSLTS